MFDGSWTTGRPPTTGAGLVAICPDVNFSTGRLATICAHVDVNGDWGAERDWHAGREIGLGLVFSWCLVRWSAGRVWGAGREIGLGLVLSWRLVRGGAELDWGAEADSDWAKLSLWTSAILLAFVTSSSVARKPKRSDLGL